MWLAWLETSQDYSPEDRKDIEAKVKELGFNRANADSPSQQVFALSWGQNDTSYQPLLVIYYGEA